MPEEIDFLSIFEGLNPEQAKQLRERIIPTLQSVREKIIQGESKNMDRRDEIEALIAQYPGFSTAEILEALITEQGGSRESQQAESKQQAERTSLDEAEA